MALLGPLAECDQVLLQTRDRIPERPGAPLFLGAVARGIVAGGVRRRPIRHVLDQGGSAALARALRGPLCHRVHRQEIVAVDANPRYAVTGAALGEGLVLTTREALEGGDRPLVVDQVENHRRLVDGGEGHRVVEVRLRARALADPAGGNAVFALDGCGHRPADRLGKLRGEVAGDGEDVAAHSVVHSWAVTSFVSFMSGWQ